MSNYGPPGGSQHGNPQEPWSGEPPPEPYEPPSDPWGDAEQNRGHQTGPDHWAEGQWSAGNDQWSRRDDQWSGHDRWGGQPASTPPDGSGTTAGGYPVHGDPGFGGYQSAAPGQYGEPGLGGAGLTPHPAGPTQQHGDFTEGYGVPTQDHSGGYHPPEAARPWSAPDAGNSAGKGNRTGVIVVLAILAVLVLGSGGLAVHLAGRDNPDTGNQAGADPTGVATEGPSADPDTPLTTPGAEPDSTTPEPRSSTDARFVTVGQCVTNEGSVEEPALAISRCDPGTYEVLERFDGQTTGQDDAKEKCSPVEGYTDWYFFDSPFDALDYVLCLKLH